MNDDEICPTYGIYFIWAIVFSHLLSKNNKNTLVFFVFICFPICVS